MNMPAMATREKNLTRALFELYYDMLFTKLITGRHFRRQIPNYKAQPASIVQAFTKAAESCAMIQADPKEYIKAQFHMFERYSQYRKRLILPQPAHLHGLGAQARWAEFHHANEAMAQRSHVGLKKAVKEFFREERKLSGLMRVLKMESAEVLAERPGDFSIEFLRHRGVWKLVKERFYEQTEE
jgi:hypothetical protein